MGPPVDLTLGCGGPAQAPSENGPHNNCYTLRALQDERRKIEGFKRELPLCIHLLDDAIENARERLAKCQTPPPVDDERESAGLSPKRSRPAVFEEFMPPKRWEQTQRDDSGNGVDAREKSGDPPGARPAWMAEAQLWTPHSEPSEAHHEKDLDGGRRPSSRLGPWGHSCQLPGGAAGGPGGPDLSLASAGGGGHAFGGAGSEVGSVDGSLRAPEGPRGSDGKIGDDTEIASNGASGAESTSAGGSPSPRKARRCWSLELHHRFVSALHQLGGSQVATPKQIRELMKVDGLTNDEVKSHLQKYRLHTQRRGPPPPPAAPQLVVLGGIWVPPEYAAAATAGGVDGPPAGHPPSPHYCRPALPHDYFARPPAGSLHVHRQPLFEPQQSASQSQSSPPGPWQVASQLSGGTQLGPGSSEVYHDESGGEDGKSDGTSWKGRPPTSAEDDAAEIHVD